MSVPKAIDNLHPAILSMLSGPLPASAAMFDKNWSRYRRCIEILKLRDLLKPTLKILDYGCGCPYVAKMLQTLGCNVTALEPYAGDTEKRVASALGVEDIFQTNASDNMQRAFDVVLMIDVIEHLAVIKPVMTEVVSMISPGGYLFVSTPNVMRTEMWLSFILRQTGHPQPLQAYLNSENSYVNHQREFTKRELIAVMEYFELSPLYTNCCDTQPSRRRLARYHEFSGTTVSPLSFKKSLYQLFLYVLRRSFPSFLGNNLFIIAQKA